ncbi:Ig-like domain-containing protein [Geomonas sp. Red875]|uniref:Ig-like domain-containing protein n=2 Tax=Geomesophilobacter sediminis TaxID=2798584 RepID=A0A8J7JEX5_9BACT|nr:Ig-like domain-containing protein [Geomesophilobacter sediminis]
MNNFLLRILIGVSLALAAGCSTSTGVNDTASPNAVLFAPTTGTVPLPNILLTANAANPFLNFSGLVQLRPAGRPMNPQEAMAYVNQREVGGTNAVSGLNAPIYIRFSRAVLPSTVNSSTVKVFRITPGAGGLETAPLSFTDVSAAFDYSYTAGSTDLQLFPKFPLEPATRYVYVVTERVKDAATGGNVIGSVYFEALKSTLPLGGAFAALEPIRANVYSDATHTQVALSGYAKTMDDLIAAASVTTVTSRNDIALIGRFITTAAGFIPTDASDTSTAIPVESALRSFAAGASLGGLPGKTWTNAVTGVAHPTPDAYYSAVLGTATTAPASITSVTTGNIESADLSMDPVIVNANPGSMDLTGITGADNPEAGVLQPFRTGTQLTGFYHVPRNIPFVYLAPTTPNGSVVIFEHGITRQKEDVVAVAGALTAAGFGVVAIDLPLHGALAIHTSSDQWGVDFAAPGAPLATRTNVQQAAFNLDRLEFTIRTGGFAAFAGAPPSQNSQFKYVGVSLGSIVGAYYLAGNTTIGSSPLYSQTTLNADMKGLLSVPGGRLAYLFKDSPSFGASLNAGLAQRGIIAGTPTYLQFFLLTQSVIDPVDPATMTTPLAFGLPSRLSGRLLMQEATTTSFSSSGTALNGDQVIPNFYTRYFGNALGGRGVLGAGFDVAPGFAQVTYANGSLPVLFMLNTNGTPKTAAPAISAAATGPTEGYFQFNQSDVTHSFLIDAVHSPVSIQLGQRQMIYFLTTGLVIDPTVVSQTLPKTTVALPKEAIGAVRVPRTMKILGGR